MTSAEINQNKNSNALAIVSLVLGILGIIIVIISFCAASIISAAIGMLLGILAFIFGLVARKQIKNGIGTASQGKLATAGFIIGIVGAVLGGVSLAMAIIIQMALSGPAIENLFEEIIENLETNQ